MNREITSCLALGAVLAAALGAAEPSPRITGFVYNYAAIPFGVLAQTKAEAARILHYAGVDIQWLDCPLSLRDADRFPACQPGPTRLALRFLPQTMADRLRRVEGRFGFALLPEGGSFGTVANVFAHDVEQLANRRGIRQGVILGHVVAHEVGHLLLGAGSHSTSGIMHDPWRLKELAIIAQGSMLFTPAEAKGLRTNIRARMAAEEAAGAAPDAALVSRK
jgi:hypothetical protein